MTNGKLAVSAIKPVAMINANADGGEKFNRNKIAITIGVSNNAAPSLAKNAEIKAPNITIIGNNRRPCPLPNLATCSAAQAKNPALSKIREMIIRATKVKVASHTMSHTTPTSDNCTTPKARATNAPPIALQPMPKPLGCHITSPKVTIKIINASMNNLT